MNIGGIATPYADYSRFTAGQQNQKQETAELEAEKTVKVQETEQPPESGGQGAGNTAAGTGADASAVSQASVKLAEQLTASSSEEDDDDEQALINKANAGSTLTQSELSRLKDADPALYASVVKANQAREELRAELKQNPSGARSSAMSAIAQNNSEGQELTRRALNDEYTSFAAKYDQAEFGSYRMR